MAYNNTIVGCTNGFSTESIGGVNSDTKYLRNNVFYNCTIDVHSDVTSLGNWVTDHNATSLSSGSSNLTGTDNVFDITSSDFVDAANNDFSIPSTSQLRDAGADLSTEFTTDILGNPRGV